MSNFIDLAQSFQLALKAMLMYTANHPRAESAIGTLAHQIQAWLSQHSPLHISASGGKLFVDGNPVEGNNLHVSALAKQLAERQISGFVIQRGMNALELLAVLQVLILKPSKIEEQGGVAKILEREKLQHISLSQTQYREVREGEGGETEGSAPGTVRANAAAENLTDALKSVAPALQDLTAMMRDWQEKLSESILPTDLFSDTLGQSISQTPAQLAGLGKVAEGMGWGDAFPSGNQMEALRQALMGLDPRTLLSVLASLKTLPAAPGGLRPAFLALAPEMLAQGASQMLAKGDSWLTVKEGLADVLRNAQDPKGMLTALSGNLGGDGHDKERLNELIHLLSWERLNPEGRLRQALDERGIFDLSQGQRLGFIHDLLEQDREEPALQVIEQMLEALTHENPLTRESAAQTLAGVAKLLQEPGLPEEAEGALMQGWSAHFGWEPVKHIHHFTVEGLQLFLALLVERGELTQAQGLIQDLEGLCAFMDEPKPWRGEALLKLRGTLCSDSLLDMALETLHGSEAPAVLNQVIPYFEFLGEAAARRLIHVLGEEPDRRRRGRLLDVIRVMGPLAIPALQDGLQANAWYLVRNTLNLLADMGDAGMMDSVAGCLRHQERRVRHAAVRALWKLGGPASAPHLLTFFPTADPETQVEVMFGLGQIQATGAVEPLLAFAQQSELNEKLRIRALDTLSQIGHPSSIPGLVDLLKRKGRIFTSAAPTEVRVAAAKALLATGTPRAELEMKQIVADEPRSKDRDALQQVMNLYRPG